MDNQPKTPEKQVKRAKFILWLGIIIIIVVGLAVAVYFVFIKTAGQGNVNVVQNINTATEVSNVGNTNVDTSDWQTYRSEKFGYQFKYPNGWKIDQSFEDMFKYEGRWVVIDSPDQIRFSLNVYFPLADGCNTVETCAKLASTGSAVEKESSGFLPATIAGREAIKELIKFKTVTPHISNQYYLYDSGNLYKFLLGKDAPYSEITVTSLLANIISSFEFTKEDRSFKNDIQINTSDWETYNNDKYNYTFKQPKDLKLDNYEYTPENAHFHGYAIWSADYEFSIKVSSPNDCFSLKECVQKHRLNLEAGDKTSGLSDVTIADKSSINEEIISSLHGYTIFYLYESTHFYTLIMSSMIIDKALTKPITDKILFTFQFTK